MRRIIYIYFVVTLVSQTVFSQIKSKEMGIYDFQLQSISGELVDLSDYKGKSILIVNTASECGYTPQYADLELVHKEFGDQLVVLGFPANNFGAQEPGSNEQIIAFCEKNFGVSFPLFSKMDVVGEQQRPLFVWLKEKTGKEPNWNFCKYLVSEDGSAVNFYPSSVNPGEIAEKL